MCFSFLSLLYTRCSIPPPFPFHSLHFALQFILLPHPFPFLLLFILNLNFLFLFYPLFPPIFLIFPYLFLILPLITLHYFNSLPFKISLPISTLPKTFITQMTFFHTEILSTFFSHFQHSPFIFSPHISLPFYHLISFYPLLYLSLLLFYET
uniref:Candidate secreted effector n=1 Tax=Meloidogyne incognita TaxID=6306 RepID=A0A914KU23_MELIC